MPMVPLTSNDEEDQHVVLRAMAWPDFEALLAIRGDRAGVRIYYLDGEIELTSSTRLHEGRKPTLSRLLEIWAMESDVALNGFGSWTLKNEIRESGAEPDECYIVGDATENDVPGRTQPEQAAPQARHRVAAVVPRGDAAEQGRARCGTRCARRSAAADVGERNDQHDPFPDAVGARARASGSALHRGQAEGNSRISSSAFAMAAAQVSARSSETRATNHSIVAAFSSSAAGRILSAGHGRAGRARMRLSNSS